ncbi:MAG: rhodanese-like domain-containing protein [Magnetococcales bacterium]|nr:rhodanese-like domain-containing protein [Magnetococcales bacterium]
MNHVKHLIVIFIFILGIGISTLQAKEILVKISNDIDFVDVKHHGKTVRIQRNQDIENVIEFDYSFTSRFCPPFCIQPMTIKEGVETIGELELLDYLKEMSSGNDDILLIDSRVKKWLERGVIPGAISIPWTKLHPVHSDSKEMAEIMELQFGVSHDGNLSSFEHAKTLIFYCNGAWCGQSPSSIKALILAGYPPHKLKWYRGGMQSWRALGFNVVIEKHE